MQAVNLLGQTFERLRVIERAGSYKVKKGAVALWLCECSCKTRIVIRGTELRKGKTKSCGCLRKEKGRLRGLQALRHGHTTKGKMTPEYNCWVRIRSRCQNPKDSSFKYYGARGIVVCSRWESFENFIEDMGYKPSNEHSIGRIDNDRNYTAKNCRWETPFEQQNNRRSNRLLCIGEITQTVTQWSRANGMESATIYRRLDRGWAAEAAIDPRDMRDPANRSQGR